VAVILTDHQNDKEDLHFTRIYYSEIYSAILLLSSEYDSLKKMNIYTLTRTTYLDFQSVPPFHLVSYLIHMLGIQFWIKFLTLFKGFDNFCG
jgi:hypothetical protein